jgi:hypothetical protein
MRATYKLSEHPTHREQDKLRIIQLHFPEANYRQENAEAAYRLVSASVDTAWFLGQKEVVVDREAFVRHIYKELLNNAAIRGPIVIPFGHEP